MGQHIEWIVSDSDILLSPLGYSVELGENRSVSPLLSRHTTFEGTGEFSVSLLGDGSFEEYPFHGLTEATTNTIVRFMANGESALSTLVVGSGQTLYCMSLDCKRITRNKVVCDSPFYIDSVSCDRLGRLWVKDTSGILTVLDRSFKVISTISISSSSLMVVADPNRMVLWQVMSDSVSMIRMADMSTSFSVATPSEVAAVLSHDFSSPSGSLFLVTTDGFSNTGLALDVLGSLIDVGMDTSSVCQWGSSGALFCSTSFSQIKVFDGTAMAEIIDTDALGIGVPSRIASVGNTAFFVSGATGEVKKVIPDPWKVTWTFSRAALGSAVEVIATRGAGTKGGLVHLASTSGVASVRDMLDEGWLYGGKTMSLAAGRSPLTVPVAAVMSPPISSHIWAKKKAIQGDGVVPMENSSSSSTSLSSVSSSSPSSTSISSTSSSSPSSSSPSSSPSSSSSPWHDFTYSEDCKTITGYTGADTDIVVPQVIKGIPVKHIGTEAFSYSLLTSVVIPVGIVDIGASAFSESSNLASVTIPDSIVDIGDYAFSNCSSLTDTAIGDGIVSIGIYAFSGCGMTGVTIPDSVTTLGAGAFYGCLSLASVTIGSGVTSMGYDEEARAGVFTYCPLLTDVVVNEGTTVIGDLAFAYCELLTRVTLIGEKGGNLISIGMGAFYCAANIATIKIPASVTSLGESAFGYCTGLTGIYFYGDAPTLGTDVFAGVPPATATVYYVSDYAANFGSSWGGLPATTWTPP